MTSNRMQPENDKVFTDRKFAKKIIDYFAPSGVCYDPCRGSGVDKSGKKGGSFYDQLPSPKHWSEIEDGRDCVDFLTEVDWAITNPPYSAKSYRKVSSHCFSISRHVVLLTRMDVALGTFARLNDAKDNGHGLKEIVVCKYQDAGFAARGFVLAAFHWQKGYKGKTKWTDWT